MPTQKREIKGHWERSLTVERQAINQDSRTVELALSSETPYERWYGIEILGHGPGEVNLERLLNGAALLMDHNSRDQIGVVESARLDSDRVLRCVVRFGRSARAEEIFQDVCDGIRQKVSVGYMTADYECTKGQGNSPDTYRFTNWTPFEASIVSVPADDTVGVGRSASGCHNDSCTDEGCMNPECEGDCTSETKCKSCTSKKTSTPGSTRELPPNPPAAPAGTTRKVVTMTPEEIAAAQKAAEELKNIREGLPSALKAERAQALQLQGIAEKMGLGAEAREILASDKPLAEARAEILALVAERGAKPLPGPGVDMSRKEAESFSYARAIQNAALRAEGLNISRCLEDEVSETIEKNLPQNYDKKGGIFVPMQLRSGLDSGTATAGAELKYTQYGGELIELLRNFAAVIGMGARVLPNLNGPVSFPSQTGDATATWVAENPGSDVAVSAPAFSSVSLAAKILQGATPFSRSLLNQAVVNVEALVRESLAQAHALAVDKAAIHGTGSAPQPKGIYRTSGIGTVAMGAVAPTYGKLQDMITAVAVANALMKNLGWLTTPGMAGKLAQTLAFSAAGSDTIWKGTYEDGVVNGYKAKATNQVSALMNALVDTGGTSHGVIFGNWADLLIGFWGAMELVVDPYTLKKQGMIEVASYQMADVTVRHAASFCVATAAALA